MVLKECYYLGRRVCRCPVALVGTVGFDVNASCIFPGRYHLGWRWGWRWRGRARARCEPELLLCSVTVINLWRGSISSQVTVAEAPRLNLSLFSSLQVCAIPAPSTAPSPQSSAVLGRDGLAWTLSKDQGVGCGRLAAASDLDCL